MDGDFLQRHKYNVLFLHELGVAIIVNSTNGDVVVVLAFLLHTYMHNVED